MECKTFLRLIISMGQPVRRFQHPTSMQYRLQFLSGSKESSVKSRLYMCIVVHSAIAVVIVGNEAHNYHIWKLSLISYNSLFLCIAIPD